MHTFPSQLLFAFYVITYPLWESEASVAPKNASIDSNGQNPDLLTSTAPNPSPTASMGTAPEKLQSPIVAPTESLVQSTPSVPVDTAPVRPISAPAPIIPPAPEPIVAAIPPDVPTVPAVAPIVPAVAPTVAPPSISVALPAPSIPETSTIPSTADALPTYSAAQPLSTLSDQTLEAPRKPDSVDPAIETQPSASDTFHGSRANFTRQCLIKYIGLCTMVLSTLIGFAIWIYRRRRQQYSHSLDVGQENFAMLRNQSQRANVAKLEKREQRILPFRSGPATQQNRTSRTGQDLYGKARTDFRTRVPSDTLSASLSFVNGEAKNTQGPPAENDDRTSSTSSDRTSVYHVQMVDPDRDSRNSFTVSDLSFDASTRATVATCPQSLESLGLCQSSLDSRDEIAGALKIADEILSIHHLQTSGVKAKGGKKPMDLSAPYTVFLDSQGSSQYESSGISNFSAQSEEFDLDRLSEIRMREL